MAKITFQEAIQKLHGDPITVAVPLTEHEKAAGYEPRKISADCWAGEECVDEAYFSIFPDWGELSHADDTPEVNQALRELCAKAAAVVGGDWRVDSGDAALYQN